ncbi:hypothetical protein GCM10011579_001210 [Streptomyces albiflavescens]|uniref:Uncharacterized protein n=1 Tax=Streptomyces albiflavescens TaxID=1623582 RepID=A0A918CY22_9ACTN|nr:hypothetical protein GCM10011579_001210 [Streptomyces albiflavescens]
MDATSRDIQSVRPPRWGRAGRRDRGCAFDEQGKAMEPVSRFLIDFVARDNRAGNILSYAYDPLALVAVDARDPSRMGPGNPLP